MFSAVVSFMAGLAVGIVILTIGLVIAATIALAWWGSLNQEVKPKTNPTEQEWNN